MKILCIGDSWTRGYGIDNPDQTWPYVLQSLTNHTVTVIAECGARNDQMLIWTETELDNNHYDLIIIGWSGVSRNPGWSLSYAPDEDVDNPERAKFFSKSTVKSLQQTWFLQRHRTNLKAKSKQCRIEHFSVFGDDPHPEQFKLQSYLEFLANKEGTYFKYFIPIFEFDFLHEKNIVTEEFALRNFDSNWQRACVEREELRMNPQRKLFLDCGHPNVQGHNLWAHYIKDTLNL